MTGPGSNVSPQNAADDAAAGVRRVFYADWEMGCCGTPFSVGDEVSWTVERTVDEMWDWERNNHGPDPDDPAPVTGRVRAIHIVSQGYRRRPGCRTYEPVPGERSLRPVRTCPKWFADGPDDDRHHYVAECGALVELEVLPADRTAQGAPEGT
ncbi:DUF6578 domain-containing protein [Streptomyces ochraceiscleroticus]|uniref:DUF6578 domain-containing protein n=1 Tax=Streptomyces ochraceiscleroticus TaxID=47761 RepID=A0ABW1MEV4_9ACTN|nr:DUF6578 domain-containing protein [Streptomyces ochraceiscleroticus]